MIDAVFISDLHLHPEEFAIQERFNTFLEWVVQNSVQSIYILGDFFHVWAGDDSLNDWSRGIAKQLHRLSEQNIKLFYMHGNRDFLLGKRFASLAGWTVLKDPTVINLNDQQIMLSHGDRYCTKDIAHQRFCRLTRNAIFPALFLRLPLSWRERLVNQVRQHSQQNYSKTPEQMDVVAESVIKHMQDKAVPCLIHGHTHKPGITEMGSELTRYVLSDWDNSPQILCFSSDQGLYYIKQD